MKTVKGDLYEAMQLILHDDIEESTKEERAAFVKLRDPYLMNIFCEIEDKDNKFSDKKKDNIKNLSNIPEAMKELERVLISDEFVDNNNKEIVKFLGQTENLEHFLKLMQYTSANTRTVFFEKLAKRALSSDLVNQKQAFSPEIL